MSSQQLTENTLPGQPTDGIAPRVDSRMEYLLEIPPPPGGNAVRRMQLTRSLSLLVFAVVAAFMAQAAPRHPTLTAVAGAAMLLANAGLAWLIGETDLPIDRAAPILGVQAALAIGLWAIWPQSQGWIILIWVMRSLGDRL